MANPYRKKMLKWVGALGRRAWTVGLVALGLPPSVSGQAEAQRTQVPERIERVRAALDGQGADSLGSIAGVVTADESPADQDPKWDDWDDWSDWNDWSDI